MTSPRRRSSRRRISPLSGGACALKLGDYQRSVIARMVVRCRAKHGIVLLHRMGSGKCLGRGTPVMMADGRNKLVEDIEVGDLLMGDDSTPRTVLSLARGREQMYRIVPVKGDPYVVNESHILSLKVSGPDALPTRWRKPRGSVIDICLRDYLDLAQCPQDSGLKGYRVGVEFPDKDVPFDPWMIGYWLGDGSSRETQVTTADAGIAHLPPLNLIMQPLPSYPITYTSADVDETPPICLQNALQQLNLVDNKHLPDVYKYNSRAVRMGILAGMLDAGGSLQSNCYDITLVNERLLDDVVFLARSLGFASYKTVYQKTCTNENPVTYYRTCISGAGLEELPLVMHRKRASPHTQEEDDALVTGITVEELGVDDYFGFAIDGNRRFLLGDFTVTHNTITAITMLQNLPEHDGAGQRIRRLIVCPEAIMQNWSSDAMDFALVYPDSQERADAYAQYDRVSYEELFSEVQKRSAAMLQRFSGALVVFDEAHNLAKMYRKLDARQQRYVEQLMAAPLRSVIMTGTPVENDFSDLTLLVNFAKGLKDDVGRLPQQEDGLFAEYGIVTRENWLKGWWPLMPIVTQGVFQLVLMSANTFLPVNPTSAMEIVSAASQFLTSQGSFGAVLGVSGKFLTGAALAAFGGPVAFSMTAASLGVPIMLSLWSIGAMSSATQDNPRKLDVAALLADIKAYVSFFDYEYYDRKVTADGAPAAFDEDDTVREDAEAPKGLVSGLLRGFGLWGGADTYQIRQWFPDARRVEDGPARVVYTDYQSSMLMCFSARRLQPSHKVALGMDAFRERAEDEVTYGKYARAIGNMSPQCAFFRTREAGSRGSALDNRFVHEPNGLSGGDLGLLSGGRAVKGRATAREFDGAAAKESPRMFSCPKFENALDFILQQRSAPAHDFLPVVYSSYDEQGFRLFSAFLSSCGFNHIVLHGDDNDKERSARLDAGAGTRYPAPGVAMRDFEEPFDWQFAVEQALAGSKAGGAALLHASADASQRGVALSQAAWRKFGPTITEYASKSAGHALRLVEEVGKFLALTSAGAAAGAAVGAATGAYAGARSYLGLKGGAVGVRVRPRPFGTDATPVCVLLHPSIMEGASFTYNPCLIALEPIPGLGPQEQVYARVLRRYPDKPKKYADVPVPPFVKRPIKTIVQMSANFNPMRYYEGLVKIWVSQFAYVFPVAMTQAFKFTLTASIGPDSQQFLRNKANEDAFAQLSVALKQLNDAKIADETCGVEDKRDAACSIWRCSDEPGSCMLMPLPEQDEDPTPLAGGKKRRRRSTARKRSPGRTIRE